MRRTAYVLFRNGEYEDSLDAPNRLQDGVASPLAAADKLDAQAGDILVAIEGETVRSWVVKVGERTIHRLGMNVSTEDDTEGR
jgi:hypothetical protein